MSTHSLEFNPLAALWSLSPEQRAKLAWNVFASECECDNCCRWRHACHMVRDYPNGFTLRHGA